MAAVQGPLRGDYISSRTMERNNSAKRRVFIQTETGCVVGMELDRSDNVQTLKKRLQLALNVPTEETSLICGDVVIKNDLSTVRNHSPLLLARNCLQRSSSLPCLSPRARDVEKRDQSCLIEVIGCSSHFLETKLLVNDIVKAVKNGIDPVPVHGGLGGAYYFKDCNGENVAIIKPTDEEPFAPNNPNGFVGKALGQPGLKRSVRVGETGLREVAAYLLDYNCFAKVPLTALVKVSHSIFNVNDSGVNGNNQQGKEPVSKIASFQQFIPHECDASDHGTSSFPVTAVHRIGILDIRILNTDRHAGNLLVRKIDIGGKFDRVELVPIDHGLCLPESLEDPYFEWINWPQASIPFSEEELEYIANLDPFRDSEILRMELPMIREACLRVLVICTLFLKEAVTYGLCLAEIGEMMSREFRGLGEEPSELELICIEARSLLQVEETVQSGIAQDEDECPFPLDYDDIYLHLSGDLEKKLAIEGKNRSKLGCGNTLSRLDEDAEEEVEVDAIDDRDGKENGTIPLDRGISISKMPTTLRTANIGEKSWRHQGKLSKEGQVGGISSGNRSVNEQLPASSTFVTVADMNEEEWQSFLENFQKLMCAAFVNHREERAGRRLKQRLGTSCKF